MLRSVDREFFQLLASNEDSDPVMNAIREAGAKKELSSDARSTMSELLEYDFNDDVMKAYKKVALLRAQNDLISEIELIHETLNLHSSIHKDVIYGIDYFRLETFEEAMVYIISLLDYSILHQEEVKLKEAIIYCYPTGFYTKEACKYIVEKLIEPNLVQQSLIYHKALELRH